MLHYISNMEKWGIDLPIGTIMKDPNTLKVYQWNGTIWTNKVCQPIQNDIAFQIQSFDSSKWNVHDVKEHEYKPKRGRPSKKTEEQRNKKRLPSEYNLFVKKQILEGAYSHMNGKDRMRLIAKDWTQNYNISDTLK